MFADQISFTFSNSTELNGFDFFIVHFSSNQNYHQPHRPHKNMAHLTHSSRQNYHSNQAAQSSTKSQFQSYNNNRSTSYLPPLLQSSSSVKPYEMTTTEINENLSKTMNSFSHHAKGSRIHQYTTLMSKNDENEHVNPILDYSEEEKRHDTVLKTRENCTNGNNSSPESADQQKNSQTPMCKVNELVRANKVSANEPISMSNGFVRAYFDRFIFFMTCVFRCAAHASIQSDFGERTGPLENIYRFA